MSDFVQDGPSLGHPWRDDATLRAWLRRTLPPDVYAALEPEWDRLGARCADEVERAGEDAEAHPPRHVPFDAWGRRVDRIEVAEGWRALDRIAAEEGLVAIGYERRHGRWSRVDQFARLHMYGPSSAIYNCPLAMTDGAARAIELHGDDALRARALPHLLSRDPAAFWTSGQWMTERTGGSDVGGTSTVARRDDDAPGGWRLWGTKWFTSATTAQMALTLARPEGAPAGSRGLALFHVELRGDDGRLQGTRVERLKDKLGTRALPTAELSLEGVPARMVGAPGEGVRRIATLFNLTRIHNAVAACGSMRRASALASSYARRRVAFGRVLARQPLHVETLARLEVERAAAVALAFRTAELLGAVECGAASADDERLLRLLTPVAKLYTARQAVAVASEAVEAFGGAGYVEDTGLPRLLRDAQVLAIWEGTTNVLALDVLRAVEREGVLAPWMADVRARLDGVRDDALAPLVQRARDALARIEAQAERAASSERDDVEGAARGFAYAIARMTAAALLVEQAAWRSGDAREDARARAIAERWCERELAPVRAVDGARRAASRLVLGWEDEGGEWDGAADGARHAPVAAPTPGAPAPAIGREASTAPLRL